MRKEEKYLVEIQNKEEELDVLDRIEIEELIRETKEFMDDDELSEKAILAAGWSEESVKKFGKTIGVSPGEHGFVNKCVGRMEGKKGWDKEKAGGFCASLVDTYKGNTKWREGSRS